MNTAAEPIDGATGSGASTGTGVAASHACWPAERFYWSVLAAPGVPVKVLRPPPAIAAALDLLLANDLPLPLDEVHAVYRRLDERRVLACAAPVASLRALPPGTLSLSPESWPEAIASECGGLPPTAINLLAGVFEPTPFRRARAMRALWVSGGVILVGALAAIGLERRASAWARDSAAAHDASRQAMLAALPEEPPTSSVLPMRLKAELDQLRRTRRPTRGDELPRDGVVALSNLLAGWPADVLARTEVVSASHENLSLSVQVDGDPQGLLDGLSAVPGWVRDEPRISRVGSRVLVTLSYRPEKPR